MPFLVFFLILALMVGIFGSVWGFIKDITLSIGGQRKMKPESKKTLMNIVYIAIGGVIGLLIAQWLITTGNNPFGTPYY